MNPRLLRKYLRYFFFIPIKLLSKVEDSANQIKKRSGLSYKGWDDDWSFYVFLAIFFTFITASIYY